MIYPSDAMLGGMFLGSSRKPGGLTNPQKNVKNLFLRGYVLIQSAFNDPIQ